MEFYPVTNILWNSHKWHLYPCPVFNIIYCPINAICPQIQNSYILTNLTEIHILNVFFKQYFYLVFFIFQCIYSRGNTTAKGGCAASEGSSGPASKGIPHGQPHGIHASSSRAPREIHARPSRAPREQNASTTRAHQHSQTTAPPFSIGLACDP